MTGVRYCRGLVLVRVACGVWLDGVHTVWDDKAGQECLAPELGHEALAASSSASCAVHTAWCDS